MQVDRIGFTPVKGGRHQTQGSVLLTEAGPRGDRAFCLIDPTDGRCLRTVENPTLLQTRASWDGALLSVELPGGTVAGEPMSTGDVRTVDYWGRTVGVERVEGPWASAYLDFLGREVVMTSTAPGDVVYGGPVTLVTNASLARLAAGVGAPVDGARFRATFQLDIEDHLDPHAEDGWAGRRLRMGTAELRVRGRFLAAVIDLSPASGVRDLALLQALSAYRRSAGEVTFGVYADVTVPGRVTERRSGPADDGVGTSARGSRGVTPACGTVQTVSWHPRAKV